jgi:hypothetical protein
MLHWLSSKSDTFEAIGKDPAFGVYKMMISVTGEGKESQIVRNYSTEGGCAEDLCSTEEKDPATYASFGSGGLPNGSDAIKIEAGDASGLTAIWSSTMHVDNTSPYNLKITGAEVVGKTVNITEGPAEDQVTVEATEGSGSVPSSGIKSLRLQVGPEQIGGPEGGCSPGPCTAQAAWTLSNELDVLVKQFIAEEQNAVISAQLRWVKKARGRAPTSACMSHLGIALGADVVWICGHQAESSIAWCRLLLAVRMLLVPSLMVLLSERNGYAPALLRRLHFRLVNAMGGPASDPATPATTDRVRGVA